jgi:putative transposase
VARQCKLIGLARSSFYYRAQQESEENLTLMRRIDEKYPKTPFYGVRRIVACVRQAGYIVNRKRVRRLMQKMGIEAIAPKLRLSQGSGGHRVYPYLLKEVVIERPNQVWNADITYIRLRRGLVYLVAVMDWFSRYVVSHEVSNALDGSFCVSALETALAKARVDIFNSDQGVQFTSREFTQVLEAAGVKVSRDGRGRVYDNIFIERLWRTVKYEEVYLHDYESGGEARQRLSDYLRFYNEERLHQALDYQTPAKVYFGGQ